MVPSDEQIGERAGLPRAMRIVRKSPR